MATKWTKEQQQVIDARQKDILVSAAAGSGKTAVLVERIIKRVLDEKNPIDIDRMLVVTFTKAAASEMRERIRIAIEKASEETSDNPHLLRQLTLVHNAQITTIDSFCLYVIRNHFQEIDLDPNFRMGDEGEMKLLRKKALDQVIEERYENKEEAFLKLVMAYAPGNSDKPILEMAENLYDVSDSYPWPQKWLKDCVKMYEAACVEDIKKAPWMQPLIKECKEQILEYRCAIEKLIAIASRSDGPGCYLKGLQKDIELYNDFLAENDYEAYYQLFSQLKYAPIGNSRGFDGDPLLLEEVKNKRDKLKAAMTKMGKDFFSQSLEEVLEKLQVISPYAKELAELTKDYRECFTQMKRDKNLLDFSDLGHLALKILIDEESGEPTEAAKEFALHYEEVMIDEYQDSNYIQEALLQAVSKACYGQHDRFMVGDVKQSIYRFRQARPEIFMEKYATYTSEESKQQKIDLHMNFRSRHEVLQFTNDIFYQIMGEDLGNVAYDEAAALYPGAKGYEEIDKVYEAEVIIGDVPENLLEDFELEDKHSFEAFMVGEKIHQLKKSLQVTDKETGKLRPMKYSDIVILLRSPGTTGNAFVEELMQQGIPAYMANTTGYFNTMEVETLLHVLSVLDNPYQDIPLASVLHSAMFSFSNEKMTKIKRTYPKESFSRAFFQYAKEHEDEQVAQFITFLEEMRASIKDTPIHEVMEQVLEKTRFLEYVSSLPAGENRRANVQKLIDQAIVYESTSYQGLFHFITYINRLQKYDVDFGAAELISENDDAVSIMSIHKSKGLEFPVVFVSGLGKQFNTMDAKGAMVLHPGYGMGLQYIDDERRMKSTTLPKKVIEHATVLETMGEELRVLYVALTRAKEKLILTGLMKDAASEVERWKEERAQQPIELLPYTIRANAKGYLDWILPAICNEHLKYEIEVVTPEALANQQVEEEIEVIDKLTTLARLKKYEKEAYVKEIEEKLSYVYPHALGNHYKSKYSVSEIKHAAMEEAYKDEQAAPLFDTEKKTGYVPEFIGGEKKLHQGALRGTAVHRYLECYDFNVLADIYQDNIGNALCDKEENAYIKENVIKQLEDMVTSGRLTMEQKELLLLNKMEKFLCSNTAYRMANAAKRNQLHLEQAFVLGKRHQELLPQKNEAEDENQGSLEILAQKEQDSDYVLVQGIIDVFWEEADGIVLLDYKTDRVEQKEELIRRYKRQLELYGEAIERIYNKSVKEILIYSFTFEETIEVCKNI